jgi:type IV secretory pathway VirB2 component (pilin)
LRGAFGAFGINRRPRRPRLRPQARRACRGEGAEFDRRLRARARRRIMMPPFQSLCRHLAAASAFAAVMIVTGPAFAAGSNMPREQPLNQILESIQGPVAKVMSVIVIIITGLTFAFGESSGGSYHLSETPLRSELRTQRASAAPRIGPSRKTPRSPPRPAECRARVRRARNRRDECCGSVRRNRRAK